MMKKRNTRYRLNSVDYIIFIVFSLLAAFMLYLFYKDLNSFTIKQNEQPIAKISFKKNTAQRRFVDNDVWEILTDSSAIYDGDRIRTSKNSEATAEFLGSENQIKLGEKSMVQIFKNKKRSAIDFIGGELFIENNSQEEVIIVYSNKKQIKVAEASEVKIYTPEKEVLQVEKESSQPEEIVIEVISGQVEIEALYAAKITNTENDSIILTSGDIAVIGEDVNNFVVNNSSKTENNTSLDADLEKNCILEADSIPNEDSISEAEIVDEEKIEPFTEDFTSPAVERLPAPTENTNIEENAPKAFTRIPLNQAKTYNEDYIKLAHFTYDESYNYQTSKPLSLWFGENHSLPEESVLELEISGTASEDIGGLIVQITRGTEEWELSHNHSYIYGTYGGGIKADEEFKAKKTLILTKSIIDTAKANLILAYDPYFYDGESSIQNLSIKINVKSYKREALKEFVKDSKVEHDFSGEELLFIKNDPRYDFYGNLDLRINMEDIIGDDYYIPEKSVIKVTFSAKSFYDLEYLQFSILTESPQYVAYLLDSNDDWKSLKFEDNGVSKILRQEDVKFTKNFTFYKALEDSTNAVMKITCPKLSNDLIPRLSNAKLIIERIK